MKFVKYISMALILCSVAYAAQNIGPADKIKTRTMTIESDGVTPTGNFEVNADLDMQSNSITDVNLVDGRDVSADGTQLDTNTTTIGTLDATPTNYTPTSATVGGHLEGVDSAIATAGNSWSDPVDSSIIPDTGSAYDLGSSANGFQTLYLQESGKMISFSGSGGTEVAQIADSVQSPSTLYTVSLGFETTSFRSMGFFTPDNSSNSGLLAFETGDSTGSFTGLMHFKTGDASGGVSGDITFETGTASTTRGDVNIDTNDLNVTATDVIFSPTELYMYGTTGMNFNDGASIDVGRFIFDFGINTTFQGATQKSLGIYALGQNSHLYLFTDANTNEDTGEAWLASGDAAGPGADSGDIYVESGDSAEATSGHVFISTGTASTTRGDIYLIDGSEGTIGHVWTSTGVGGQGNWAAPAGGGGDAWSDPVDSSITVDTEDIYDIGTDSAPFNQIIANQFRVARAGGTVIDGRLEANTALPSGATCDYCLVSANAAGNGSGDLGIFAQNGNGSGGNMYFEIGATTNTSGDFNFFTDGSGATRGGFFVDVYDIQFDFENTATFNGPVVFSDAKSNTASNTTLTADDQAVSPDTDFLIIGSDSVTAIDRTFTISSGSAGQKVTILWGSNAGEILDSGAMNLSATWTPGNGDTLSIIFSGGTWYEIGRSDN